MVTLHIDIILELHEKYSGWCEIFTDGSKCGDKLGVAILDPYRKKKDDFKIT